MSSPASTSSLQRALADLGGDVELRAQGRDVGAGILLEANDQPARGRRQIDAGALGQPFDQLAALVAADQRGQGPGGFGQRVRVFGDREALADAAAGGDAVAQLALPATAS